MSGPSARWAAVLLSAGVLALAGRHLAAEAPAENPQVEDELDRLQGSWSLVEATRDGQRMPAQMVARTKLVIAGRQLQFPHDPNLEGEITIHPERRPRGIDSKAVRGPEAGTTFLGIYDLKGSQLRVCFARPGDPRPKVFSAPRGSGRQLKVWRRMEGE